MVGGKGKWSASSKSKRRLIQEEQGFEQQLLGSWWKDEANQKKFERAAKQKYGLQSSSRLDLFLKSMTRCFPTLPVSILEWHDIFFGDCQVYLQNNLEIFMRNEFRVSIIGEISRIPKSLQEVIKHVQEATIDHTKHDLMFAINYGGRRDITQATRKISEKIKANLVDPQDINEDLIEKELWTNISGRVMPDPDLVIRVGGQLRLSNYLLWQMAYSELYFIDINAPDFGEEELIKALLSFQNRKRNFGS